jgi:hypothetical protein
MKKIILLVLAIGSISTAAIAERPAGAGAQVGDDGTSDKGAVIHDNYKGPPK